jgi:hypothetical protein
MLSHLKQRIVEALAKTSSATLATSGPAGLQISLCPYRTDDLRLFVLLPSQSEHLVNLEAKPEIAVTADSWRLFGSAHRAEPDCMPQSWQTGKSAWLDVIVITPSRFEFVEPGDANVRETIDVD